MAKRKSQKFVSVERAKLEAIVDQNVRLKKARERVLVQAWFPYVLIVACVLGAWFGSWLGHL